MAHLIEEWKPVVGFEGWYEVSNLGGIKRVMKGKGFKRSILSPVTGKIGYIAVITYGKPGSDDRVIICEAKRCTTVKEGKAWGEKQIADPAWREEMVNQNPNITYVIE